eukprot:2504567-Rhodomonas_salina.3
MHTAFNFQVTYSTSLAAPWLSFALLNDKLPSSSQSSSVVGTSTSTSAAPLGGCEPRGGAEEMACPASSPESASGSTSTPVSGSDKSRVTGTVKEGIVGGRRRPTDCPPASVSASAVRVKDRRQRFKPESQEPSVKRQEAGASSTQKAAAPARRRADPMKSGAAVQGFGPERRRRARRQGAARRRWARGRHSSRTACALPETDSCRAPCLAGPVENASIPQRPYRPA